MYYNTALERLSLPNLTTVGDGFLCKNKALKSLEAPKLKKVGRDFLYNNTVLKRGDASKDGKPNASKKNILVRLFQGGKGEHSGLKSFLSKNQEGINSSNDGKSNASKKNILVRLFQGGKGNH